jgi:hypothetical protein
VRPNLTVNQTRPAHALIFGPHLVGGPVTFNVRPHKEAHGGNNG